MIRFLVRHPKLGKAFYESKPKPQSHAAMPVRLREGHELNASDWQRKQQRVRFLAAFYRAKSEQRLSKAEECWADLMQNFQGP